MLGEAVFFIIAEVVHCSCGEKAFYPTPNEAEMEMKAGFV